MFYATVNVHGVNVKFSGAVSSDLDRLILAVSEKGPSGVQRFKKTRSGIFLCREDWKYERDAHGKRIEYSTDLRRIENDVLAIIGQGDFVRTIKA